MARVICKEHEEIIIWYTHFSLTLRIILKTFSTICLLEGDRGRSIWKVKTFFLMSTPYVMKSLPSEYVLVPKKIFPRLHKWVECGFWDSLLNMCSALKQGKTRQKNLNQQDFSKSKWKKLLIQFVVWHFSIKKVIFIILTLSVAFLSIVSSLGVTKCSFDVKYELWKMIWKMSVTLSGTKLHKWWPNRKCKACPGTSTCLGNVLHSMPIFEKKTFRSWTWLYSDFNQSFSFETFPFL